LVEWFLSFEWPVVGDFTRHSVAFRACAASRALFHSIILLEFYCD
jgi:hypothetical protein